MLTNKKKKTLTTKDTKVHEGLRWVWIASCDFVSLVVDGFNRSPVFHRQF
jgi:hypothetical protein